uniref:HypC/HybG/HupF family hydrogenase formation chaperone n=1 Tax=Nocardia aurea TaxID=2144174 RepID=UPI00130035AF
VRAARDMAARFQRKGRLLTFGQGATAADAGHLAVEFTHPVIVGKRALPAISLAGDACAQGSAFADRLRALGRPEDITVGLCVGHGDVLAALAAARELGMLTVALTAGTPADGAPADHLLAARSDDPLIARETHVTTYHLLWELVHVFLDDPGLAPLTPSACDESGTCVTCADTAVPVRVTELRPDGLALVDTGAGIEEISVALVAARVGDTVLVHAKEAIAVLGGDGS